MSLKICAHKSKKKFKIVSEALEARQSWFLWLVVSVYSRREKTSLQSAQRPQRLFASIGVDWCGQETEGFAVHSFTALPVWLPKAAERQWKINVIYMYYIVIFLYGFSENFSEFQKTFRIFRMTIHFFGISEKTSILLPSRNGVR